MPYLDGIKMWQKAGIAFLLSFFNTVFAAPTTIKVALDWYINPDHAPLLVAKTYGYFAQEGLDVQFIEPSNSTAARNLVLSQQADIGIDYQPEALLALSQGIPLKVFANLIPTPLNCIASLSDGPIKTLQDLRHQSIAYSGDPLEAALINIELTHAGLDPKSVRLVPVNMDLTQVLLARKVAAVSGFMRNVEPVQLKYQGIATHLFYPEENGVPTYAELVLIANPQHIDAPTLQKFVTAINAAAATMQAHPVETWNKVVTAYPTELASSKTIAEENALIWQASAHYFTTNASNINVIHYQNYNHFLLKSGLIKSTIPLEQYWWPISAVAK